MCLCELKNFWGGGLGILAVLIKKTVNFYNIIKPYDPRKMSTYIPKNKYKNVLSGFRLRKLYVSKTTNNSKLHKQMTG